MKKTFTLTFLLLTVLISTAQILPNSGFETWEPFSGYEDPLDWNTVNQYTSLIGVTTVEKSTDAYSGDYSAKLETKSVLIYDVPGLLTLAKVTVNIQAATYSFSGGIALSDRVNKLTGMFKYSGANEDSASAVIVSYRHLEGQEIDTVGFGYGFMHNAGEWTSFTVNMYPWSEAQPDSFNVIIMSSGSLDFNVGSVLYVDDLSLETVTGIIDLSKETTTVKVYPNPVSDFVKFELKNSEENMKLSIFDNSGRQIKQLTFNGNSTEVNLGGLPSGIYSYQLTGENKIIGSGYFVKK